MAKATHSRNRLDAICADEILPGATVCRRLGISRNTLYGPMRKMGLEPTKFGKRFYYDGAEILSLFRQMAKEQRAAGKAAE